VSGLAAIMEGIAASLEPLTATVDGLQITPYLNIEPTPPSIDIQPAGRSGFPVSEEGWEEVFTIRARVSTPDDIGGQEVLLALMDVDGPTSVIAALRVDRTFGGLVGSSAVDERTGYQPYAGAGGDWPRCAWMLRTIQ
jgi:hypothetical protein